MFDFHNHFTNINAVRKTGELLPQNLKELKTDTIKDKIKYSEIGLDKRFTDIVPKDKQIEIFKACLKEAQAQNCPVHIHCVGFIQDTINILRDYKNLNILWHRFNGSIETAKQLTKMNITVSIANDYKGNIKELFNTANVVPETDYDGSDILEYQSLLNENYTKIAEALDISVNQLEDLVLNAGKAFTNPSSSGN